jgi:hypothetical protein
MKRAALLALGAAVVAGGSWLAYRRYSISEEETMCKRFEVADACFEMAVRLYGAGMTSAAEQAVTDHCRIRQRLGDSRGLVGAVSCIRETAQRAQLEAIR